MAIVFYLAWSIILDLQTEWYNIIFGFEGAQPNFAFVVKFYEPVPSHIKTDYTR